MESDKFRPTWMRAASIVVAAFVAIGIIALLAEKGGGDAATQTIESGTNGIAGSPILLMFHAGGFVEGSPKLLEREAVPVAERRGFTIVNVGYPLGDPEKALRAARQVARGYSKQHPPLCAYGESAGGMLAARLAQGDLGVDAAATYSPLTDLTTYSGGFFAASKRAQVIGRDSRVPILAMMARGDDPAYTRDIQRWADADDDVQLRRVSGDHLGESGEYGSNVRQAMRWLARRCA